jgi:hypothetical protein
MRVQIASAAFAASLVFTSGGAWAHELNKPLPPAGCEGAPADAVLELPAPAAYWMQIVCMESGHTLAPIPGDAWLIRQDSRTFSISAESGAEDSGAAQESYFVSIGLNDLTQAQKHEAPALFRERAGAPIGQPFKDVASLTLVGNRGRQTTLYVFVGEEGPVAGLACLGSCDKTVAVSVVHPEAESIAE